MIDAEFGKAVAHRQAGLPAAHYGDGMVGPADNRHVSSTEKPCVRSVSSGITERNATRRSREVEETGASREVTGRRGGQAGGGDGGAGRRERGRALPAASWAWAQPAGAS